MNEAWSKIKSSLSFLGQIPWFITSIGVILLLSFITNVVHAFRIKFNPSIDLSIFDPDIFGSFTDWLTAFIAGVTGYYIWKTFQSQKEVQKMQAIITKVDVNDKRFSNTPILGARFNKYYKDDQIAYDRTFIVIELYIINNGEGKANGFKIINPKDEKNPISNQEHEILYPATANHFILWLPESLVDECETDSLDLIIEYADIFGSIFRQGLHIDLQKLKSNPNNSIYLSKQKVHFDILNPIRDSV
jgi:hypothetical protein